MASLQVDLPFEQVVPRGCGRVFEIRHEDLRAAVEGVDDHLAVDGAGDLDAAVEEILREWRDLTTFLRGWLSGFGEEVGLLAGVEAMLAGDALGEEMLALAVEGAMKLDDEVEGLGGENGVSWAGLRWGLEVRCRVPVWSWGMFLSSMGVQWSELPPSDSTKQIPFRG